MRQERHPAIRTAALFYNRRRPEAFAKTLDAAQLLHEAGVSVRIYAPDEHELPGYITRMGPAEALNDAQLAVVVGGDGSILRVAAHAALRSIPIIGVNMGHLGFMSELEPDELAMLRTVLAGRYTLERRMMLRVQTIRGGVTYPRGHVLNDAVVARGTVARILDLTVAADGAEVGAYRADGVIAATPTGSTAYSLAAGGPIIEPAARNIIITPVCAHALYARSFVLAPARRVSITAASDAVLTLDGRDGVMISPGETVVVTRSPYTTDLVRIKNRSVFDVLHTKLS
ncbi:MAG: NAD(+)/NADH kinase [Clostridiaceae bacterium]|nr:NAD(+)/NADH kinase [Clostridiaceae bacterium]